MAEPTKSGIAIRFGASSASKGLRNSPRATPSSALGKRPRPQFTHNDDDSSDEEAEAPQPESITHFGENGAEYVDDDRARRDRHRAEDKKNARRRTKSPTDGASPTLDKPDKLEEETVQWGLTITKKPKEEKANPEEPKIDDAPQKPRTADEEAMDALLGNTIRKTIPLHRTEDDAFRDATAKAPEADDLSTYNAIPVEGFGAALLMGQGWDGKMRGPKAKEISRRPTGMGLGAKKVKADEELGGWDHKGKGGKNGKNDRRPRLDDYRREKDKERDRREDRHRDSYKNERERERDRDRRGDRDRNRDRERDRDRGRDSHKSGERDRDRDRDYRQ